MKTQINLTTSSCDLDRFRSRADLLDLLGEDGIELTYFEEDARGLVPPERVTGLHMNCLPCWLDFWRGDRAACLREFGDGETVRTVFGGETPDALLRHYERDLMHARDYGAEYVVFHACDSSIEEAFTGRPRHRDEEVIDGAAELLNELFRDAADGPWLLLENLWYAGHRFTDPDMTARLLERVSYPKTALMLDTGHLMHTNPGLRSQAEGVRYVHALLDRHGDLCRYIRGVHLHQSLSGALMTRTQAAPPKLGSTYAQRSEQLFCYVFSLDRHQPFTDPGVRELVGRIAPEYLTFELISRDLDEHRRLLQAQRAVFGR